MRTLILGFVSATLIALSWSIGTEGRSPNERPDWWKPYENAPAIQVAPEVVAPKGDIPSRTEEAVTRSAPAGVPENLVIGAEGAPHSSTELAPAIDGAQVIQEASRDLGGGKPAFWRGAALFGLFLLLGGGLVLGAIRWLSNQLPEPPHPTRRRRF